MRVKLMGVFKRLNKTNNGEIKYKKWQAKILNNIKILQHFRSDQA